MEARVTGPVSQNTLRQAKKGGDDAPVSHGLAARVAVCPQGKTGLLQPIDMGTLCSLFALIGTRIERVHVARFARLQPLIPGCSLFASRPKVKSCIRLACGNKRTSFEPGMPGLETIEGSHSQAVGALGPCRTCSFGLSETALAHVFTAINLIRLDWMCFWRIDGREDGGFALRYLRFRCSR